MRKFINKKQKEAYLESPVLLQAGILFFLAIALYINTIGFDYALDDTMVITENKFTKQGLQGIDDIWSSDAMSGFLDNPEKLLPGGRYRPLSLTTFAIEYEFFGRNPFISHLINILLYGFLAISVFFLLRHMFKFQYQKPWYLTLPFIATALFTAHPIHTEAVANIKGRDEIMAMLGAVIALWMILKYIDTRKGYYMVIAALSYFLGILSKENAATVIAVVPLMLLVFRRESSKQYLITTIPLLLVALAWLVLRYNALGFWTNEVEQVLLLNDPFVNATTAERYATVFYTWLIYLRLMFFPHPLTHDYYPYHINLVDFNNPLVIISLVIWLGLFFFAVIRIWRRDVVAFSVLFFMITFSVSSNLLFNIGTFMNERFIFMPSLGFVIILGWFFNQTLRRAIRNRLIYKRLVIFLVILVMLAGSAKTVMRNLAWKDDLTLFTTDVKTSSGSTKVNISAGGKLREEAMKPGNEAVRDSLLRLSEKYLRRGLEIHPRNYQGAILLGQNYLDREMYEQAYNIYDFVLDNKKGHAKAYNNLHHLVQKTRVAGRPDISIRAGKRILKDNPNDNDVRFDMALTYQQTDSISKAVNMLQSIIDRDHTYAEAYRELGGIYGQQLGDMELAKEYLLKALEINPSDYSTVQNLGIVFAQERNFAQAVTFFKKAIEIDPGSENAYRNLIVTYQQMGREDKAAQYMQKLSRLKQR